MKLDKMLHKIVRDASLAQLENGHLRDAVFNSVVAVFDFLRERSESRFDGNDLVGHAFSLQNPRLIVSELETESGRNDQKGFMQLLKGVYQGVRNPKAHSLKSDLTEESAGQYLVLSSLLARRIGQAKLAFPRTNGIYKTSDSVESCKILRFYPDGTVISVSVSGESPEDISWLNLENAKQIGYPIGAYSRTGKSIEFTVKTKLGSVNYDGEIDNLSIHLDIESEINGHRDRRLFKFHTI